MQIFAVMRARWVIGIAGGVLLLALALLFGRSEPRRMGARVLLQTNEGTLFYLVQVTNSTRGPHRFFASSETTADGQTWERLHAYEHLSVTLPPGHSAQFALYRPTHGKRRVTVDCYPVNNTALERVIFEVKVIVGSLPSRGYTVYLDVE